VKYNTYFGLLEIIFSAVYSYFIATGAEILPVFVPCGFSPETYQSNPLINLGYFSVNEKRLGRCIPSV
jgi:hypothetical protein